MKIYEIPIEYAIITFPFIAFILTLPFLIYQYRKYGSIPFLRSAIFYSFILYIIVVYFLVILPLPSKEYVANLKTPTMQLIPFNFVGNIIKETGFELTKISTYLPAIKNSSVYTVLFNILLTLPLGVYLRYYFNCKGYKVIIYSFLLSLFFELTQLSGLYGIYPRPYRLFDVDDLIMNTLGGFLGYIITPIFLKILPIREEIDNKSYEKGKKVTLTRRMTAFFVDAFFLSLFVATFSIITHNNPIKKYIPILIIIIYYLIFPTFNKGRTIGKIILKIKITKVNDEDATWYQIFFRYFLGYFMFIIPPTLWLQPLFELLKINSNIRFIISISAFIFLVVNYISLFIMIFKKDKRILYEKITSTKDFSTIIYNKNNLDKELQEEK